MKVLVVGGTGYIGTSVVRQLRIAGHQPVVLTRTHARSAATPESRVGDLTDLGSLREAVTPDIDALVHAATPTGDWDADLAAIETLTTSLTGRALVYLSGIWVLGSTPDGADESAPTDPLEIVAGRPRLEERVMTAPEVRGVVIRPGIVHGAGGGIPGLLVAWARDAGAGRYVGEPTVRWPMVHVDDLAELVVLAVERAEAGTVLHGVAEPAVPVKELAAAADVAAGGSGRTEPWPQEQAATQLGGPFAEALALDQEVSALAASSLGWTPSRSDAVTDVREGSYRTDTGIEVFGADHENQADVAAILALVARVEHAQHHELPAAFMEEFSRHDPVWTTSHGVRLSGWDTISEFTHKVLPGAMKESTARYDVARILFIRPDVAAVNVHQRPVTHDGLALPDVPEGRPLYVLAKEAGQWKIAAAQNTQVRDVGRK